MLRRIPLLVSGAILPERATKVMLREEQLLSCPLVLRGEDAVVTNQSLEPTSQIIPLDPVYIFVSTIYNHMGASSNLLII